MHCPSTRPSQDAVASSIEQFDPTQLRCEVLRRVAREASRGSIVGVGPLGPGLQDFGEEDGTSFQEHLTYVLDCLWSALRFILFGPTDDDSEQSVPPMGNQEVKETDSGQSQSSSANANSGNVHTATSRKSRAGAIWSYLKKQYHNLKRELKIWIFLAFPGDSLFHDPCVEQLYQWQHMQQWSPRVDWSLVAFLQMLVWDLAANPPYLSTLLLHFNSAFLTMILVHKALFLACRGHPKIWRLSRGALLCGFLLGRGAVCHPFLATALPNDPAEQSVQSMRAASSFIGLGMTNLSAILALQLHTVDTLLLCFAHGLACVCWACLAMRLSSGDAWHMLFVGHSLVAFVCVWQQHEQERLERASFEQDLLMKRGLLLRSADCMVRQGTKDDFNVSMHLLYRGRCVEKLNLNL